MLGKLVGKLFPGRSDAEFEAIEHSAQDFGLDLKGVLEAHTAWKDRLEKQLSGKADAGIDVATAADDRICELGRWLHGPGRQRFGKLPEYEEAVQAHAEFHRMAAQVLIEHQSGNTEGARTLLRTEFRSASNRNQIALVSLFMAGR